MDRAPGFYPGCCGFDPCLVFQFGASVRRGKLQLRLLETRREGKEPADNGKMAQATRSRLAPGHGGTYILPWQHGTSRRSVGAPAARLASAQ